MQDKESSRVAAVMVTYEPELVRLRDALDAAERQARPVFVVDNGSSNVELLRAVIAGRDEVRLIELSDNIGIGAALNIGCIEANRSNPAWILTLDQDTVIDARAIASVFESFERLPVREQTKCGILALSRLTAPLDTRRRRFVEKSLVIRELGDIRERRYVITSGNLVRRDVFDSVSYYENFFIDAVDTKFCVDVRAAGWTILESGAPLMDHALGTRARIRGQEKIYEPAHRIYYVARNETYLVLRRQLPLRVSARDTLGLARVLVHVQGAHGVIAGALAIGLGTFDALTARMGRREYRVLKSRSR